MSLTHNTYLWEHWKFNAEQRLKAFNFYVALSIFANGMVFAALEKATHPAVLVLLGGFVSLLALVFTVVDARSRHLLHLTKQGLKQLEAGLPEHARLFLLDDQRRWRWVRYTAAFNLLFVMQLLFGLGVTAYGISRW
ncbi:hypothetical protein [Aquabacterium sp.]|jgi:hypothetical protein|uniref:hypothetical protein n=1 Tax=Aquabacterium TaxID=92793 RepID=UPI001D3402A7|nr:hypothetical protein [Aquabacterium sp.]MBT9609526.1 hypothetical protein [Aquabacterium sp.]